MFDEEKDFNHRVIEIDGMKIKVPEEFDVIIEKESGNIKIVKAKSTISNFKSSNIMEHKSRYNSMIESIKKNPIVLKIVCFLLLAAIITGGVAIYSGMYKEETLSLSEKVSLLVIMYIGVVIGGLISLIALYYLYCSWTIPFNIKKISDYLKKSRDSFN